MKPREPDTVCPNPKCGKMFEEPLLLRDLSKNPAERYYVCPHCIIKLDDFAGEYQEKASQVSVKHPEELKEKNSSPCTHHVGYLKTVPKGGPVPDGCLTCPELLRCMFKK